MNTTKKINWDSLDYHTYVTDWNTGMEYKVKSIFGDSSYVVKNVCLYDEYNHESRWVTWKDLENEFDWKNKF